MSPSSNTVIVTPQPPIANNIDGIATFVAHFSRLLSEAGHQLTLIYTEPFPQTEAPWKPDYEQRGIRVINLFSRLRPLRTYPGFPPEVRISQLAADAIPHDADVVYFADWKANGLHLLRSRRYSGARLPAVVTVLHGCSAWQRHGQQRWPDSYQELALDFGERYAAQYSDFVASPSHYMLNWAAKNGWRLPSDDHVSKLNYPFFLNRRKPEPLTSRAAHFKRIIFYGRQETRQGFELFVRALMALEGQPCLGSVQEIVLLGGQGAHGYGNVASAATLLETALRIKVATLSVDSVSAVNYLTGCASDSLVVIPSRADNLAYTLIETSLIPGLNVICANAGALPEVLGAAGSDQLFDPYAKALKQKLECWLVAASRNDAQLGHYDWQAANHGWLAFHERVCAYTQQLRREQSNVRPTFSRPEYTPAREKSVDVCIPFYNLGRYLPYLLTSLEKQTSQDFNVFIVNDGSTEPDSVAVFEKMRNRYTDKGWRFITQENQGVCATRNYAVSLGNAPYLCFVDADNVAAPNMIERFVAAITHSQDDCLTCDLYMFENEGSPYLAGLLLPPVMTYAPVGNSPSINVLENPFGDINCIMRRSVFEAVGGYTLSYDRYINQEDRELLTRISLAGYRIDVIPEFLFYYRYRSDSRLRSTEHYLNETRVMGVYDAYLRALGLAELIPLILGLKYRVLEGEHLGHTPNDELDYLIHRVRWLTLVKALRGKAQKNLRRAFRRGR